MKKQRANWFVYSLIFDQFKHYFIFILLFIFIYSLLKFLELNLHFFTCQLSSYFTDTTFQVILYRSSIFVSIFYIFLFYVSANLSFLANFTSFYSIWFFRALYLPKWLIDRYFLSNCWFISLFSWYLAV